MKKVSIIIPLYNLQQTIGKCIDSTQRQDIAPEEYEVIVIDDGSTDGSLAAAQEAARESGNVRVFSRPNAGVSEARNFGLDTAMGDYIVFLDADDYLEPRILGTAIAAMERDTLDMLCVRAQAVDGQGKTIPFWSDRFFTNFGSCVWTGKDILRRGMIPIIWVYIYRRDLFTGHSLRMKPIRHEDEEFVPRALYYARRVGYLPELFYNYYQRPDSFMNNYKPEQAFYMIPAMQSLAQFAEQVEQDGDREGGKLIRQRIGEATFAHCRSTVERDAANARKLIGRLRKSGLFPLRHRHLKLYHILLNLSTPLFIRYYQMQGNKNK